MKKEKPSQEMFEKNRLCKEKCSGFVFLAQTRNSEVLGSLQCSESQDLVVPCPCALILGFDPAVQYQKFSRFEFANKFNRTDEFEILRPFGYVMPKQPDAGDALLLGVLKGFLWRFSFFSRSQTTAELYSFLGPKLLAIEFSEHQKQVLANQQSIKKRIAFKCSPDHVLLSVQELHFLYDFLRSRAENLQNRIVVLVVFNDEFSQLVGSKGQRELFAKVLQLLNRQEIPLAVVSAVALLAASQEFRAGAESAARASYKDENQRLRFRSSKHRVKQNSVHSFQELLEPEIFDLLIHSLLLGFQAAVQKFQKPLPAHHTEMLNDF